MKPLDEGDLLQERYRVERRLGGGLVTSTWAATDQRSGEQVVIKLLLLRGISDWKVVELFEREAATLRRLDHPAIPRYLDSFTEDRGGDVAMALVQERVAGDDLATLLQRGQRFSERQLRTLASQLLGVLAYLHGQSPPVVHRDLKPSNILLRPDGGVALVDFGAATAALSSQGAGGSTLVGTCGYMPPEQFLGRAVPATDLYALGCTLVHLATRIHPAELPLSGAKLAFRERTRLGPRLVELIDRLIEPEVEERPADATAALAILRRRPPAMALFRRSRWPLLLGPPTLLLAAATVVLLAVHPSLPPAPAGAIPTHAAGSGGWTLTDLPKAPDAASNGFAELSDELAKAQLHLPDLPAELGWLGERRPGLSKEARWHEAVLARGALNRLLAERESREALGNSPSYVSLLMLTGATKRPRFADDCPLEPGAFCPWPELLAMHRVAEADCLRTVLTGAWQSALFKLSQLARADADLACTARSLTAHLVAWANVRRDIELTRLILAGIRSGEAGPILGTQVQGAVSPLSQIRPADLSPARVVTAEYLLATAALDDATAENRSRAAKKGHGPGCSLDDGPTRSELEQYFRAMDSYLTTPVTDQLPQPPGSADWWDCLHEPTGDPWRRQMLRRLGSWKELLQQREALWLDLYQFSADFLVPQPGGG